MKTVIVFVISFFFVSILTAQDNPYKIFGYEAEVNYSCKSELVIKNKDTTSVVSCISYDSENRILTVFDYRNNKINSFLIDPSDIFIWVSTDPAEKKYPAMSPYSAFADNPTLITDPSGDTLRIGGEQSYTLNDLKSLIPKNYQSMLEVTSSNTVIFNNYSSLPEDIKKYKGVALINNLISSKKNYYYTTSNELLAYNPVSGQTGKVVYDPNSSNSQNVNNAIQNFSITPYWPDKPNAQYLPVNGIDGAVRVPQGSFTVENVFTNMPTAVNRAVLVFHELLENYFRTETDLTKNSNYSYAPNGGMYYSSKSTAISGGAHQAAGNQGKKFAKELKYSTSGATGTAQNWKFSPKKK